MTPLNYIGVLYRIIQESFVNMENMFDLMNQEVGATSGDTVKQISAGRARPSKLQSFGKVWKSAICGV